MVAIRYALLALDVPVRWLDAAHGTVALFNPSFLASDVGWGVMRSVGDLALTASFLLLGAGAALALALRYAAAAAQGGTRGPVRWVVGVLGAAVVPAGAALLAALVARRAVLDATLGYTDQSGPVLDGVTAAVLASLVLLLTATLFLIAAAVVVAWAGDDRRRLAGTLLPVALAVAVAGGVAAATGRAPVAPVVAMAALGSALGGVLLGRPERWVWPLTFRGTLAGALVLAPVLYGLMAPSLAERSDARLADAARAFADTRDNRVAFAIDQVLAEARADDALRPALLDAIARADSARRADAPAAPDSTQRTLDELVSGLLGTSLLGSLADVSAELRLVSPSGATLGSSVEGSRPVALAATDSLDFGAMRREFEAGGGEGFIRRTQALAGGQPGSRSAAIGPLLGDDGRPAAWVYLRTAPRAARSATETPFPRVLAPTGLFGLDDEALSYAEYRDGALVRSRGVAPLRLDGEVRAALVAGGSGIYRAERLGGRALRAYYEASGDAREVVAVRAPATDGLDVLFVLLRMTLAGLAGGALLYAVGIPIRRRLGLFPPPRTRFRDKVLNRFLVVGLASVTLTGLIGQSVIREQNQQVVRELLRQRLQRAEAVLGTEDLAPPAATERSASARLDAVAAALGVDVHLYRGADLEASSRRQLVRQRLIDSRLPGSVYRALFVDGEPYAFSTDRIGTFTYTTGYKALPATEARPQGVVAVPTLSEQAAIEVGQARMVAYLFGGLLGLLIVIVAFAVLLAGQLTRPFSRLRQGLEAVGAGADEEPIPVDTHDEVGELVESFNAMQAQLAESRRQLAAQERELAWSEMARQVAHEIKNPLMPMKLSVQHLQRTFRAPGEEAPPEQVRFAGQFGRTTEMLIDQIETLNRIASDFSAFARMPMRAPETVDLNEVVREAAALFESPLAESGRAALEVDLAEGALRVLADHDELRRVFVNLLANALQAIPERPAPGRIVLRTRREPDGAAVGEVQDDGEGIPAEIRPKVFQPSFSTKTSGMGLGLAISRRAVEAAGGTIAFETEIGAGTTFVVRLPAPAEAPPSNPERPGA
jgi:signal transduction histidine kinase